MHWVAAQLPGISSVTFRDARRPPGAAARPPNMAQGSVLVPLQLEMAQEESALLEYAMRASRGAVYLQCTGPAASEAPTTTTLDYIAQSLEPSAHSMPRCDVFPLLPHLGWTPALLASRLTDVEEMVAAAEHAQECHQILDQLNSLRQQAQLPSLSLTLTAGHQQQQAAPPPPVSGGSSVSSELGAAAEEEPPGLHARVIGDWEGPLQFNKVAVGGTFDRLHAGHRLLLAAAAIVCKSTGQVAVGVTGDKLLANKKNRELLEPYEEREAAAVGYIRVVNPGISVVAGPLNDPNEPPAAAIDPAFDALVVSEETVPGAHAINHHRQQQGFPPLVIVVVGLIYSRWRDTKLSSTDLRQADAAAAAAGAGGSSGRGSPRAGSPRHVGVA